LVYVAWGLDFGGWRLASGVGVDRKKKMKDFAPESGDACFGVRAKVNRRVDAVPH
jgi:hypothetical protein